jgi:dipeptidase
MMPQSRGGRAGFWCTFGPMCDCVVAVGPETAAGTTLFAKNSDRKAGECQPFLQLSEASHPSRATVRCTHVEIPQVAETYRVMGHSPWWVWGFEQGVNEHAVAIGNHSIFSNEPIDERPGLIGMDLVRLGLERGRSAREALEVIATLIEAHGQGGAAVAPGANGYHNGFTLADASEAWLLETSNRRWAARRVTLEAMSNHYSLGADWEIGSRDIEAVARAEGWWRRPGRIDVAAAYRDRRIPAYTIEGRQRRARELLREGRGRHDVASLQRLLCDHLDGGPAWQPGDATAGDERYYTLCAHGGFVGWTTAGLVAPLPADRSAPWPVWACFATPCTGIFLPVYLDGVIPAALARGGKEPEPDSAWWIFWRLQEAAGADPVRHTRVLRAAWAELEKSIEAERPAVETAAREALRAGDRDGAAEHVSDFMERTVEAALELAEALRARIQ